MNTPAPELRKCPHCLVNSETIATETWLAKMFCAAATEEFFFEDQGQECLAMVLFAERELQPPMSARQLLLRMSELRAPLP